MVIFVTQSLSYLSHTARGTIGHLYWSKGVIVGVTTPDCESRPGVLASKNPSALVFVVPFVIFVRNNICILYYLPFVIFVRGDICLL